jgi:general transcription factor 3C polypeptide 3 (transcription factor C subunit 4)
VLGIFLLAEILNENVCSRLEMKIRPRDGSTSNSTGMLTKDWDFDIGEREAEFKDELRAASGIGHKRRKVSMVALS